MLETRRKNPTTVPPDDLSPNLDNVWQSHGASMSALLGDVGLESPTYVIGVTVVTQIPGEF
jgi:hypothetical protein